MARTRFKAQLVIDPETGRPPEDVRGQTALIAEQGTSTPLELTYDMAGLRPMTNPVQITPEITTPEFYTDEGITEADVVSGVYRIGIDSLAAVRQVATEARDAARAAATSAAAAAGLVGAPADLAIAAALAAVGSHSREQVRQIVTSLGGGTTGGTLEAGSVDFEELNPTLQSAIRQAQAALDEEGVQDAVAAMLVSAVGGNVTPVYDDATGTIALTAEGGTGTGVGEGTFAGGTVRAVYDAGTGTTALSGGDVGWIRWEASGAHPARPTDNPATLVMWFGPLPAPPVVASGTGGRHAHDVYYEMVTA